MWRPRPGANATTRPPTSNEQRREKPMGGLRPDRCHSPMAVQLRSVSVTVTLASIEWAELVATRNHLRNVATGAVSVAPFRSSQSRSLGSGVETCARGESQGNLVGIDSPDTPALDELHRGPRRSGPSLHSPIAEVSGRRQCGSLTTGTSRPSSSPSAGARDTVGRRMPAVIGRTPLVLCDRADSQPVRTPPVLCPASISRGVSWPPTAAPSVSPISGIWC